MKDTFVDVPCGWQYGFPRIWDHEKPFEETFLREKQDWAISKGYPRELAHSKSIHFRSWEDKKVEIMTPKEILKEIVMALFNGVVVDDLSKDEKRLLQTLKREGIVDIQTEYVPLCGDYDFVYLKMEYFNEDQSPAVEEPEET